METPEGQRRRLPAEDPCAGRLHDICGALLLYRTKTGNLPERLEDLKEADLAGIPEVLQCPVSGKPYLYDKSLAALPGAAGRVIVRDAEPVHSGLRWAISIAEPKKGEPLITRVVAVR
jgi:hypothetical protein